MPGLAHNNKLRNLAIDSPWRSLPVTWVSIVKLSLLVAEPPLKSDSCLGTCRHAPRQ